MNGVNQKDDILNNPCYVCGAEDQWDYHKAEEELCSRACRCPHCGELVKG